jgi:hypothetical protein
MEEINKFLEYKIPSIGFWTKESPFILILNVYFSVCTWNGGIEIVIISCKYNNKIRDALYSKMRNIHNSNKTNNKYGTIVKHCCIRGSYIISKRNYITNCNIKYFAKKTAQITIDNVGYKQFTIGSKYCIAGKNDMNFFPKVRISKIQEINIDNSNGTLNSIKFNSLKQRKNVFMNFSKDIEDIFNLYNPINWIQMKYLEQKYGDLYSKKLEYLGIKYINPGYDDEYINKYGPKQIDAFKTAIDILHMHRYFCISKNCFTCNAIYMITRKMIEKTDNTLSYLSNILVKKLENK